MWNTPSLFFYSSMVTCSNSWRFFVIDVLFELTILTIGLVSLVSLFLMAYQPLFNTKAILIEEQLWDYLTHSWEDKGVHTFSKGICPKANVIAWLEFELVYYDSAVHRFNLLRSQIHEYGHVRNGWNGHRMFITIEYIKNIGISKFENT